MTKEYQYFKFRQSSEDSKETEEMGETYFLPVAPVLSLLFPSLFSALWFGLSNYSASFFKEALILYDPQ